MSDKYRGHEIEQMYAYKDNGQPVSENPNRPCGHCGKENTREGHDGCLGTLPDVINACCGHGEEEEAYVMFNNKAILRGREAIDSMRLHAHYPELIKQIYEALEESE